MRALTKSLAVIGLASLTPGIGLAGTAPPVPLGIELGAPLGAVLSTTLGGQLPLAGGGLIGLVAAAVVGGIWLVRRKR